jgi:leader peptidase (prepilin peptidase) / N-methyltransferase
LRGVHSLLVVGTSLAGVLIGAALDPVAQRLADASRAEEEARRAEAEQYETVLSEAEDARLEGATDEDRPEVTPRLVAALLPAGTAPVRTGAAALITGALFGAVADHFGADVLVAPFCLFFALLVSVSMTDLTHRLVPRWVIYPSLALIVPLLLVTSAVDHRWHSLDGAVVAGAVAFALFFVVWWFVPRGMGFGDVRLAGVIGLVVGYLSLLHAYVAFLAGFLVGLLFGLVLLLVTRSGRRTAIPFAPSLCVGAVIAVLWGGQIAHALFHTS